MLNVWYFRMLVSSSCNHVHTARGVAFPLPHCFVFVLLLLSLLLFLTGYLLSSIGCTLLIYFFLLLYIPPYSTFECTFPPLSTIMPVCFHHRPPLRLHVRVRIHISANAQWIDGNGVDSAVHSRMGSLLSACRNIYPLHLQRQGKQQKKKKRWL
uniref:Uncharacterized protein TCIL3000_10_13430 n=1 Tax=Trypanosoma congolense (strain IL3000) TaxID=1068625 RepID=G0UYU3_TRYCI|nr:unnamed protein product [Trypanosoma congolense IL3000]